MASYDRLVGEVGLREAAGWLLGQTVRRAEVAGLEHLPGTGPLLVVSNHPGLTDTLALFASLPRPDLRILAASRPFLRALPCTSRQLFYLGEDESDGLGVLRRAVAHLRAGGVILTFPGGRIEPDPEVLVGAVEALEAWSPSVGLIARLVPETRLVPAIVSGVLSPAAQRLPITRLRRKREDRERLGAMLQMALPLYQGVRVRVAFGPSLQVADLLEAGADARAITTAAIAAARCLITEPPQHWQSLVPSGDPPIRGRG
jgi:1-acyl-sn-glycerol-3-phosphate acyltransferase